MSDGLNVTNAVPPICNRHGESMVLSFYDRPGSAPGNGYVCRSCAKERMVEQTLKLSGKAETSPERAELQVSLLNEIGLTLTAMAKEQVAQGVSMVTAFASHTQRLQNIADDRDRDHQLYRQMDERIQGLLVEIQATVPLMLGSLENRIMEQRSQLLDYQTSLATRLAQIEERLANSYDAVVTKFTHIEKCLTYIEECAKRGRVRGDETCGRLSAIEGHLERLISERKAGKTARKRPAHKAGKRLKKSKL